MKRSTLEILSCPICHGNLSLHPQAGDGTITDGRLFCTNCQRDYQIKDGIPHFIELEELKDLNHQFARSYDRVSRFYNLFTKLTFLAMGGERKARMEILQHMELIGGRVLEVSIGTGNNLPYLFESPQVDEVFGLDISAGQLSRCQGLISRRKWPVELFLGKAESLPFKSGSFNSVFHIGGINFFSDKKRAIDEMIRVARPGSKILIADEVERLARQIDRLPGFSSSDQVQQADVSPPIHLVPEGMQELQMHDIWKAHGDPHGYCIEFRKPLP